MPGLLFPLSLAGLLALALPLLVHLARRSEAEVVDFAALRWLRAAPRPKARVRFDERWLLAVRLLLLALLALLLAQPVWRGWVDRTPVVAVVPGGDAVEMRARLGALGDDVRVVPLGADWPSELRALDARLGEGVRLTVLVPAVVQGVDAARLRLSRTVDWQAIEGAMPVRRAVPAGPLRLAVRAADGDARVRWFRAAAVALGGAADVAGLDAGLPASGGVLVWLGDGAVPAAVRDWVAAGGVAVVTGGVAEGIVVWRDAEGVVATERRIGRGRLVRLVRPLTAAALPALVEADFPARLRALVMGEAPAPARAAAADVAPLPGGVRLVDAGRDLQPWLALLIAAVLLVERWLATRAARGALP